MRLSTVFCPARLFYLQVFRADFLIPRLVWISHYCLLNRFVLRRNARLLKMHTCRHSSISAVIAEHDMMSNVGHRLVVDAPAVGFVALEHDYNEFECYALSAAAYDACMSWHYGTPYLGLIIQFMSRDDTDNALCAKLSMMPLAYCSIWIHPVAATI